MRPRSLRAPAAIGGNVSDSCDLAQPALALPVPIDEDDRIDRPDNLHAQYRLRDVDVCTERHRLEPQERILHAVRVHRGPAAAVPGAERLHEIEGLATA